MKKAVLSPFPACFLAVFALFSTTGCVKKKIYQTEVTRRQALEASQAVFQKELADRKTEAVDLIEKVGSLNRTIGEQSAEIKNLQSKSSQQVAQLSESSGKILEEKRKIEADLAENRTKLKAAETKLADIEKIENARKAALDELSSALASGFSEAGFSTILVETRDQKVVVTLPDELIFDKNGLTVALSGMPALAVVGRKMAERPDVQALIVAHTDNVFPREKTIRDSWDWSMQRGIVLTKIFAREHGANENQMTVAGSGEFRPIASNDSPEGRAANRRTEIFLTPKMP